MTLRTSSVCKAEPLVVGRIYVLVGGHILRYQGAYGKSGDERHTLKRVGAFRPPSQGLVEPASGYSDTADRALYQLTPQHIPQLRCRIAQLEARKLSSEEEYLVIEELKAQYYAYARETRSSLRVDVLAELEELMTQIKEEPDHREEA
jgi:hypothetical protein